MGMNLAVYTKAADITGNYRIFGTSQVKNYNHVLFHNKLLLCFYDNNCCFYYNVFPQKNHYKSKIKHAMYEKDFIFYVLHKITTRIQYQELLL